MNKEQLEEIENPPALPQRPVEPLIREVSKVPGLPPAGVMTETGHHFLTALAKHGMSMRSCAAMFGMGHDWMSRQIKNNDAVRGAWELGQAEDEAEYRAERKVLRKIAPQVHIHEGKTRYGEVPVEHKVVEHKVTPVIATNPVSSNDIEEWKRKYAPEQPAPPKEVN